MWEQNTEEARSRRWHNRRRVVHKVRVLLVSRVAKGMGDRQRFTVFAEWIVRQLPKAHRILDVAGGCGDLSFWLQAAGCECAILDPKARHRRRQNKATLIKMHARDYHCQVGEWDAVVGMHPDSATLDVVRIASEAQCPFAVVPCCHYLPDGRPFRATERQWQTHIENYAVSCGFDVWVGILDIRGKNLVIKGWPRL